MIGSYAMGSTNSSTPSDGFSPDLSAAGVNSGKLELFPTDNVDASGGSAEEASAQSLKLFGMTVLVTGSHIPFFRAARDSKSLPFDVQEEKHVQTSLPCNQGGINLHIALDKVKGIVDHVSETTVENSSKSTGIIEGRQVHLDFPQWLAGRRNNEALPGGDSFDGRLQRSLR